MSKKVVIFGEIMLRLATPGFLRFGETDVLNATFGGGEANVAVSLASYGMHACFITRLPQNDLGEVCVMNLRKLGVDTHQIVRGGDRIGLYFLESGAVSRGGKVVYDRAHSAFADIRPGMVDWDKALDGADFFHWTGINPAVSEGAAAVCLEGIRAANARGITVSCDPNYRKQLWKWGKEPSEVMPEMVEGCDILLGNVMDAEKMFGIRLQGVDTSKGYVEGAAYESVCRQIRARFPRCKKIITTLRGSVNASHNSWSSLLFDGQRLFESANYQITHIVDRVGGGDSFMGGLIYGLLTYPEDDQKALDFAIAASCLKHTIYGDFNMVTVEEVEKLMSGDISGRIDI